MFRVGYSVFWGPAQAILGVVDIEVDTLSLHHLAGRQKVNHNEVILCNSTQTVVLRDS